MKGEGKSRAHFTPDRRRLLYEDYMKLLEQEGRTSGQRDIEEALAGIYNCDVRTIQRNLPRAKEEAGFEKPSEQQGKKEIDPLVVQRKLRHEEDLGGLCHKVTLFCERHECDLINIKTIGELPEFESGMAFSGKDRLLQSNLLDHLKAEFPELTGLKSLDELPVEYINKLRELAAKRSFKGTCDICKSWSS